MINDKIITAAFILYLYDWADLNQSPTEFDDQFLARLSKNWIDNWVPALNEEHCGDCTKVSAPCIRCGIERYISDAERLISNLRS